MSDRSVCHLEIRSNGEAVDITPFVDRFVWRESMISGGFSWEMMFKAEAWREWDKLLFGRDKPVHQFRLRTTEANSIVSTEWRTAVVDKSRASFSQDVSMVGHIKGGDRRLLLAQGTRTRAHTDTTTQRILQRIAQDHGLNAKIAETGPQDSWVQARESDWAFARRLARESSTPAGRCDTYLWMDEDTLRFVAPTLGVPSVRRYDLDQVESRIDGWAGTYNGRTADRAGAARLRGVGFDFGTKKAIIFEMNETSATSQPALAARVPRRMSDGLRVFAVTYSQSSMVEQVVRSRWGRYAPRYLGVRIRTRPDLTIRPNNVISLDANLDKRRETPYMGRYVCLEVEHEMVGGVIVTFLSCYRREAQEGDDAPTGVSADTTATRDRNQSAGLPPKTILVAQEV